MEMYLTEEELVEARNFVTFIKCFDLEEQKKGLIFAAGYKSGVMAEKQNQKEKIEV